MYSTNYSCGGKTIHQSIVINSQTILDQSTEVHNLNCVIHVWIDEFKFRFWIDESFWNWNWGCHSESNLNQIIQWLKIPESHPCLPIMQFLRLEHKGTFSDVIVFHPPLVCSCSVLNLFLHTSWFSPRWMDSSCWSFREIHPPDFPKMHILNPPSTLMNFSWRSARQINISWKEDD